MRHGFRILATTAFAVLFSISAFAQQVRYDGHRVVRVQIDNPPELDLVLGLTDDVWTENIGVGPLDIRVSPDQFEMLKATGLEYEVMIDDVQQIIDEQASGIAGPGPFDDYMTLPEVYAFVDDLALQRPDLAEKQVIGQSIEGRDIVMLKITGPGGGDKPGIFYEFCIHAREWITVPNGLYLAYHLINDYDTDPYVRELVDRADWYIVPVVNVDGYNLTHNGQRMWRKNRRNNGDGTYGVDLNRNWAAGWGGPGSSGDTSSETYRGTAPFSEPETTALSNFISAHPNIVTFHDVHSYSQLLLYPYGYKAELPANQDEYAAVGNEMAQIIHGVHGMTYNPGNCYHILYQASGAAMDWAHEDADALSFSFELRDTGQYGFLLPPEQIIPTCEEIFPSLLYQADYTTRPVTIEFPNGRPAYVGPGVDTIIDFAILPAVQNVDPNGASVFVRTTAGGSFTEYAVTHMGGDDYRAVLPARSCGDDTEYYFVATGDAGGVVRSPAGAPDAFYSAPVGTATEIFDDNFETDTGWTVQSQNLDTGEWVRVDPNGTSAQPEDDNPEGTGTYCYVTGQGSAGGSVGEADVDGGPTSLISPVFDLTTVPNATISYYRWFYNDDGDDTLVVEVSDDDGGSWTTVETVASEPAWAFHSFDVADYVNLTATVRVRFSTADQPNNSITEAAIDDVYVFSFTCDDGIVKGDTNCDGALNTLDIEPFILAMTDPDGYANTYPDCDIASADMNNDGAVNTLDIEGFIDAIIP
jgi:murein tripeptide amidase MpaA